MNRLKAQRPWARAVVFGFSAAALGCGDDSAAGGGGAGGGTGGTPISDLTELSCPTPGLLPFVTETNAFASDDNAFTAEGSPRSKDEASDTLGVPGGPRANTYVAAEQATPATDQPYDGKKARTGNSAGLSAVALRGEAVSLWTYDPAAQAWLTLGRTDTDDEGAYSIARTGGSTELGRPVYSILEADGSCAEHYEYLLDPGTQVIITDIDGTLTLSDEELFQQISDGAYVPVQMGSAAELVSAWADKGYVIIYMTARPHMFRAETRTWLRDQGFPTGPVLTANALVVDETARTYKASWVSRVLDDFQWDVVAAYGNAQSDIDAYEDGGIPKDITFIVGELAGTSGTVAVENNDYAAHITDFVEPYPDAN
ncbi:MAG: hypothetical protein IPG04_26795 [Polyangiaceae bacterium]|nr:hypothetical protein [Polyangiaceae bacterium]